MTRLLLPCLAALAAATSLATAASLAAARDPIACGLIVPPNPTTAKGLATPYYLTNSPYNATVNCTMSNELHQVFVNAVILDTTTNTLYNYNPLVHDLNVPLPAANLPAVPVIPEGSIIAIFIASNFNAFGIVGDTLHLIGNGTSLVDGNCVTGVLRGDKTDTFLQFATCNSIEFFAESLRLVKDGKLKVPQLGTGKDGLPCPSVRSFDLVDSTQSDTVPTAYILSEDGTTAQNTTGNFDRLMVKDDDSEIILCESDAVLLDHLDEALGCSSWKIKDLTEPTGNIYVSNFAAGELQAAVYQQYPIALVPADDPDVLSTIGKAEPSLLKLNTYRAVVGQPPVEHLTDADKVSYCKALLSVGTKRLVASKSLMEKYPTPDNETGTNLYTFWAARFAETYNDPVEGLGCDVALSIPNPVNCTNDPCSAAVVTLLDPLSLYVPKPSTTPGSSTSGNSLDQNTSAIIGLAVALGVVAIASVAFIAFVYNRTSGFTQLGSNVQLNNA